MTRITLTLAAIGMVLMLLTASCGLLTKSVTLRYRITVAVDTPQGERTGSSVWEASVSPSYAASTAIVHSYRGEAVAVDLPGGTLFALLRSDTGASDYPALLVDRWARQHADDTGQPFSNDDRYLGWRALKKAGGAVQLPFASLSQPTGADGYPLLVRFRDIHDPASVERVDPANLAASFGAGVRLKAITVEVTEENITNTIQKRLSWIDHLDRYRKTASNPFTNVLPAEIGGFRSL